MSESGDVALANGPESRYVVDAADALLRGELGGARAALIEGADAVGWHALAHRIDVAGRALTCDAGLTPDTIPQELDLVPAVLATRLTSMPPHCPDVLERWCVPRHDHHLPLDDLWPSFLMLVWLIDQAGYPAEVVV